MRNKNLKKTVLQKKPNKKTKTIKVYLRHEKRSN